MNTGDRLLLRGHTIVVARTGEPQGNPPRLFCKIEHNGNTGSFLVSELEPFDPPLPGDVP